MNRAAASEIGAATFIDDDSVRSETPAEMDGVLKRSQAQALFGSGKIPRVSALDEQSNKYKCRDDWRALRRQDLHAEAIRPNLNTLLLKAKAMGLSSSKLKKALAVFLANQSEIPNQDFISVIDFDKTERQDRMYIVDLKKGTITALKTAAGRGSDPRHTGLASRFSNRGSSNATSLGCYLAGSEYVGKHRRSLRLHGFEPGINNNACNRSIVIHKAPYVGSGRSKGCFSVSPREINTVIDKLEGGGLICAYKDGKTEEVPVPTAKHYSKHRKYRRYRAHHYN